MKTTFRTHIGRVRTINEDHVHIEWNEPSCLAVVADGMGGHRAGEVASEMAVQFMKEAYQSASHMTTPSAVEQWLVDTLRAVNDELLNYQETHPDCEGMGTTVVAAVVHPTFATIAHVGDSRCYVKTEHGLQLMTEDHSFVNELVKSGQISKEDAEHHPRRNILLRALGTTEKVVIDVKSIELETGDVLLLCSDGLSNKVKEESLVEMLAHIQSIEQLADELIALANENGGEDNISLALIQSDWNDEGGGSKC